MIAVLVVAATFLFYGVTSQTLSSNVLNCNNVRCGNGNKCVMAEPQNCVGCPLRPRCVQQECNTGCTSPCLSRNRCVLVATNCCPTSACRAPAATTRRPPIFTFPPIFTWGPWPFAAEGEGAGPAETTKTTK